MDVLREHLIVSKQIVRVNQRGGALDPDSAFAVVEDVHVELQAELEAAMAIAAE